jgi:hypothetical protein
VDIAEWDVANGAVNSVAMKVIGETSSIKIQDLIPSKTRMFSLDGANLPNGALIIN